MPPPLHTLILAAYAGAEDRERALGAGHRIHRPKPIEPVAVAVADFSPTPSRRKRWTKHCGS